MKGIILAGGLATRLGPLTLSNNKHLLPIYNAPMIYYPINTLVSAGIKDIMIVVSGPFSGNFISVLRNGQDFGCKIYYGYQDKPNGGIADALSVCEDFADNDNICVILGDNTTDADISSAVNSFNERVSEELLKIINITPMAHLFLKQVPDAHRFGVATLFNNEFKVKKIVEKPKEPETDLAVTGVYLYDKSVFSLVKECKPSNRGELEITDVNNLYIDRGSVTYSMLNGYWKDAGTYDSLLEASNFWKEKGGLKLKENK